MTPSVITTVCSIADTMCKWLTIGSAEDAIRKQRAHLERCVNPAWWGLDMRLYCTSVFTTIIPFHQHISPAILSREAWCLLEVMIFYAP